jgi:acetyltransferase-like isoleucine patch superfamily enzyme
MIFYKVYRAINSRVWFLFNRRRFKKLGARSFVIKPIIITPFCVEIGHDVVVQANSRIEGVTSYEGDNFNPVIILDDNCTIQQNIHLTCAKRVYIGKYTAIAANVTITDIHHPYEDIFLPIEKQRLLISPVSIGSECKIYNNAVILPGTTIGKHCTVGANSVVSGNIPDYSVVVGIPGRIIKRYNEGKKEWLKTDKDGNFINSNLE